MKKTQIVRIVMLLLSVLPLSNSWGQNPEEKSITLRFVEERGADYRLLLWGESEGEVVFDWGDGCTERFPLHTHATGFKGKTYSDQLVIKGNIAVLECSGNNLKEIDVRRMPSLTHLISRKNFNSSLDLSNNERLKMLVVQDSPLTQLDVSKHLQLDTLIVTNNKLSSLKLPTQNSALTFLDCGANPSLRTLDVRHAPRLKKLSALQTLITRYDLKNNTELHYFAAGLGKPLEQLALPNNNHIDTLILPMAGLKNLDLSQTKRLKTLVTDNNFDLQALDISGMSDLRTLLCENNKISSLAISEAPLLEMLVCNNNLLTQLDLSASNRLKFLICHSNHLSELDLRACSNLSEVDCSHNPQLTKVQLSPTLTSLNCSNCALKEIAVEKLSSLLHLDCNDNQISNLNLAPLTKIVGLNCGQNPLSSIAVEQLTDLQDLTVNKTQIKALDLSKATNIRFVSVQETAMDVCALDDLYRSLRSKRPEDDENELGGLLLFNQSNGIANVSKTAIAIEKGWMVSTIGDGTGCKDSAVENIDTASLSIQTTPTGWCISSIPPNVSHLSLMDIGGKTISQHSVERGEVYVEAPHSGIFIISLGGRSARLCIK